jgi:hypothetical protein
VSTHELVLSTKEQRDLGTLEGVVQKGLATFIEVGRALAEIRDRKLYRVEYGTFESTVARSGC